MAPIFHLVRHAQGFHNLSVENQQIPDPSLTPLGQSQCRDLSQRFPSHSAVTHVVVSPMRRTLQTALQAFAPAIQPNGIVVQALAYIQEISSLPCDVGTPPEVLAAEFAAEPVDFALLAPDWFDKGPNSPYHPAVEKLEKRARAARVWLRELVRGAKGDAQVAVVSHGGFLHFLTGDWEGMDTNSGTAWENAEFRSYELVDPEGKDENASFRETSESWRRRRGSAEGLSETERMELRAVHLSDFHDSNEQQQ